MNEPRPVLSEINKKDLSERDICTKFITPAIEAAGWNINAQIREEYTLTNGRVIVRGQFHTRGKSKRADYVLFYKPNIPIAVIEAKDNSHSIGSGLQQALGYARLLNVPFAFNSNWRRILEYFSSAAQIGLTATPKETRTVSNIDYFKDPLYTYSLRQGINDGFLAPYKVVRIDIDKDLTGWRPDKGMLDKYGNEIADLFMALIMHLLKHDTGRVAVVLKAGRQNISGSMSIPIPKGTNPTPKANPCRLRSLIRRKTRGQWRP